MSLNARSALAVRDGQFMPAMTPMVDVVLVILVFFMAATVIGGREWLLDASRAEAPVSAGSGLPEPVFRVIVRGDGTVDGFGTRAFAPGELSGVVGSALAGVDLAGVECVVTPEDGARYEDVVTVMAQLKQAGLRGVGLR